MVLVDLGRSRGHRRAIANHTQGAIHILGMLLAVSSGLMVLGCVSYWWDTLREGRKEIER
jgi:hypothetical protein